MAREYPLILSSKLIASLTGVAFACGISSAYGAPPEIHAGYDARFSDNVKKAASSEQSDVENRFVLSGFYRTDPGKCTGSIDGDVAYSVYAESTFDPETEIDSDILGRCEISHSLYWDMENQTREVARTNRRGDTPDNSTRKNVFRSGPSYIWNASEVDTVNISSRYEQTELSDPDETDSNRVTGSLAWIHLFAKDFSAGLSGSLNDVDFDNGAEVRTETVNSTFDKRWTRASLSGTVGISEIETDLGMVREDSEGFVGNLSFRRSIEAGGIIFLRATRELTDKTSDLDIRFGEFTFQRTDSLTLKATSLETGINKKLSNGDSFAGTAFFNRSDYIGADEQQDQAGLRTSYSRRISPRLSVNAAARYEYLTFEADQSDDEIVAGSLGLTYRASRRLEMTAKVGRTLRSSDVAAQEYEENWVSLFINYRVW